MNNSAAKKLCLDLLQADTEEEVIQLLMTAKLWNDAKSWRLYGDRDNNYSTIGNQQGRPEAALVEKLINAVDARLMNECQRQGINPTSDKAPSSIQQAVSRFFEKRELRGDIGGAIKVWPKTMQLQEARNITLAATGSRQAPSIVITDCGEGQTPARMPDTFLSIDRSNKLRIPFVQGKFNMGGTGVLKFCGKNSIQLIISRRNPEIISAMKESDPTAENWGFTVVRRERPHEGVGSVRNSVFRYLAPVGADSSPESGALLSFPSETLALMPERNQAYVREIGYGSCIKLYEYDMKGFKSNILLGRDCLKTRLEILLPDPALPMRLYECRDFKGKAGSYETTMLGVLGRLEEDSAGNLEEGYPSPAPFRVHGHEMIATIYAFKGDKAESYRTNEGIIFAINGQTHGFIPKTFFSRSAVKMGRLAKSLLVVVECSSLSVDAREDLFMNSRDRLSNHELRKAIEEALEDLVAKHPGLKELREARRSEEITERLADSKPLEDVLQSILKSSPSLEKLFLLGQRLSRPHKAGAQGNRDGGGGGGEDGAGKFHGKAHPTFFRFHKHHEGELLVRTAEQGRRCRIKFDTDVENEYFSRIANRGHYTVDVISGSLDGNELDSTLTLHNGIANWSINIPDDEVSIGDEITIQCTVSDDVIPEAHVNVAKLKVVPQSVNESGGGARQSRKGAGEPGAGGTGAAGSDGTQGEEGPPAPAGIKFPPMFPVREGDEMWKEHEFDEQTACKVIEDSDGDSEQSVYTFYVNVDNISLRTDMKGLSEDVALREAKFFYGNVLIGLALIHQDKNQPKPVRKNASSNGEQDAAQIAETVNATTRALAPFLVPMIDFLGALTPDEAAGIAQAGDEE